MNTETPKRPQVRGRLGWAIGLVASAFLIGVWTVVVNAPVLSHPSGLNLLVFFLFGGLAGGAYLVGFFVLILALAFLLRWARRRRSGRE